MSKQAVLVFFLVLAALFLGMNRAAYKGYFADDEVDNISWTAYVSPADFIQALVTPRFNADNFRPVGHFYFHVMERWFGLDFPGYVVFIQLFHLLNAWLLWVLARRIGAPPLGAALAVTLFTLHMALFDSVWKPMYVFDVLCATFCLAALILYAGRRWVLSFVCFWFAYKAKELAVMLPAVLFCYEFLLGERRIKPLLPFFAASLSFGLQAMLMNPNKDNDYTFRFTLAALEKTSPFYASRVFMVPYLGFALLAGPVCTRNRRAWFGFAMAALFFFPLLFLPGRVYSAYCYLPFTGLALAASAIPLTTVSLQASVAAVLLLWLPWNYQQMRAARREKLGRDDQVRTYITTLKAFAAKGEHIDNIVFAGAPEGFNRWGIEGAIKYIYKRGDINIRFEGDKEAAQVYSTPRFALLTWDWQQKRLFAIAHTPDTRDASFVEVNPSAPVWQLGPGWFPPEQTYRWTGPVATARLFRPAGARKFQLRVNIGPGQLKAVGPPTVTVTIGGHSLAPHIFSQPALQMAEWDMEPAAEPGNVEVKFLVSPTFVPEGDGRTLGIAIRAFGFPPES